LKEYVTLAATKFPGIKSIQIANEIEGRPQYTDLLGRESVPDWFKWVKQANPKMRPRLMALTAWTGVRCKRRIAALNGPAKILRLAVLLRLDLVAAQTRRTD
jgi:hypothetical protein